MLDEGVAGINNRCVSRYRIGGEPPQQDRCKRGRKSEMNQAQSIPHMGVHVGAEAGTRPAIQIVPVKGLPIVAVVIAGLIVSIVGDWRWALMFYHVAGGGLWTGIDLFVGLVIGPIIGRLSIPARAEFTARFMPMMVLIMPTLVIMTLASGFQLGVDLGYLAPASPNHGWLVASFVVVGVMATIALGLLEPANIAVLFEMKKPHPNGTVIGSLMRRFVYTAGVTGCMQIATLVIMTRVASQ
jgi:hypothetical protein